MGYIAPEGTPKAEKAGPRTRGELFPMCPFGACFVPLCVRLASSPPFQVCLAFALSPLVSAKRLHRPLCVHLASSPPLCVLLAFLCPFCIHLVSSPVCLFGVCFVPPVSVWRRSLCVCLALKGLNEDLKSLGKVLKILNNAQKDLTKAFLTRS